MFFLSEIISDERFNKKEIKLPIALGKSISGIPIVGDLSFNASFANSWNYRFWKICMY